MSRSFPAAGCVSRPTVTTWLTPELRAEFEGAGFWTRDTWVDVLVRDAARDPHQIAVVDEEGSLTRSQVMGLARRLASYLASKGIRKGDVVTLILPNWREFYVIHAALGLLGAVISPLLPRAGTNEITHVIHTSGSRFVFAAAEHRGSSPWQVAAAAAQSVDAILGVVPVRGGENSLDDILSEPWEESFPIEAATIDARDWDTVTFTSGTESLPKAVVHSHQSTMFGLRAYISETLGLDSRDKVFMPSPICHASGIQWGLRTAIYIGAPLVLQDRWDATRAIQLIDAHQSTYTLAATPFLIDLIAAADAGFGSGASLRFAASGGTTIPRSLVENIQRAFGAELMAVFGASETYVATAARPGAEPEALATDGAPLRGVQVRIVDQEGTPVARGEVGEIVTRGPHLFLGYLGDPDITDRAFLGEWYRFGDLGRIDEGGFLSVTGRIKDIIIRGGENISAREIEDTLLADPRVRSAAVVAYPDDRLGERVCVAVVPERGEELTLESVNQFLASQGLARFKFPERIHVLDELPMTATGKVRKVELRELIASLDVR